MEPQMNLIITGSEDKSLFFFKFITNEKGIDMNPIRSVKLDYVAINFEWLSYEVRTVNFKKKINVLVLINNHKLCAPAPRNCFWWHIPRVQFSVCIGNGILF